MGRIMRRIGTGSATQRVELGGYTEPQKITENLEQGTNYSTYIATEFKASATVKGSIVKVSLSFNAKTASSSSGWKQIYTLPDGIPKPSSNEAVNTISSANKMQQFLVSTTGDVSINGGYGTTNAELCSAEIIYIV